MCKYCGNNGEYETIYTGYANVPVGWMPCCEYGAMLESGVPEEKVNALRLSHRRQLVVEYFRREYTEEVDIPF